MTGIVVAGATLFSLLNDKGACFRESHQRMDIWRRHSTTVKRIGTFEQTSWWSKDVVLKTIFGSFNNPNRALFTEIIIIFNPIIANEEIHAIIKSGVLGYIEGLLKFETALTVQCTCKCFSVLRHSPNTCKLCNWIY